MRSAARCDSEAGCGVAAFVPSVVSIATGDGARLPKGCSAHGGGGASQALPSRDPRFTPPKGAQRLNRTTVLPDPNVDRAPISLSSVLHTGFAAVVRRAPAEHESSGGNRPCPSCTGRLQGTNEGTGRPVGSRCELTCGVPYPVQRRDCAAGFRGTRLCAISGLLSRIHHSHVKHFRRSSVLRGPYHPPARECAGPTARLAPDAPASCRLPTYAS